MNATTAIRHARTLHTDARSKGFDVNLRQCFILARAMDRAADQILADEKEAKRNDRKRRADVCGY